MANLKSPLLRKLKTALIKRFPSPDKVKLEDHDGIIGVITSRAFWGMETIDRQNLIGDIVETNLSREERWQVQAIVGITPDEETGYLANGE